MTTNQIAYFKAKTEAEHYGKQDSETAKHNRITESQQTSALAESQRSNLARESLTAQAQAEQARHNAETEAQQWANINAGIQLTQAKTEGQQIHNALERTYGELNYIFGNTEVGSLVKAAIYGTDVLKSALTGTGTKGTEVGGTPRYTVDSIPSSRDAKAYEQYQAKQKLNAQLSTLKQAQSKYRNIK